VTPRSRTATKGPVAGRTSTAFSRATTAFTLATTAVGLTTATAIALHAGCAPAPTQWTVAVSTDAPLPTFGDRLLLEVLVDDGSLACAGCRHDVGLDARTQWPVSFGVLPAARSETLHVRARLYRADHVGPDGLPLADGDGVLDAVGILPEADGDTRVALTLRGECFERVSSTAARTSCGAPERPLPPETPDRTLSPGAWPPTAPAACPEGVPDGMRCIPGGVFLCGDVRAPPVDVAYDAGTATTAVPERAVRLDTFLLDVDEMTVGDLRRLAQAGRIAFASDAGAPGAPTIAEPQNPQTGADAGVDPACTWLGVDTDAHDDLPLACIPWASANAICHARGGRLPTEAEWEYAAGNTQRETTYPWGESPDVQDLCLHAYVGRGRSTSAGAPENPVCLASADDAGAAPGPAARNAPTRDLTDRGVRNMGGNLQEYVADNYQVYAGPCWTAGGPLLQDPSCDAGGPVSPRSVRGGGWQGSPHLAVVAERNLVPPHYRGDAFTGVRCAADLAR
jgi:formylglycine-generating enzyme required for sulfatase activity